MEFRAGYATVEVSKPTASEEVLGREVGGFNFDLTLRNSALVASMPGAQLPKAHKTGTTICGVVYKDGVVLGADTRATEGSIVCDKNCDKIHYIAPNIYCCGAGTSADTENTTRLISSQLELLRLQTGCESRVVTAMTMLKRRLFQYQGHVSAALVLGGVDATGAHLYTVYPHGSTDKLPFVSMGSGSLAAMAVLEAGYKDDMTEEEATALVAGAIRAGIFNDLGSGSNVDITVLRSASAAEAASAGAAATAPATGAKQRLSILRNYQTPNEVEELRRKITRPSGRNIPRGATTVVKELFHKSIAVTTVTAPGTTAKAGGASDSKSAS